MFRVLNLTLHNFKGFKEAEFSFEKPRTILGGPNGYGKTSIFDALELLFTGSILRMQVYRRGHDDRTNLKDDYKPLVYDTSIPEIVIAATVQLSENVVVKVKRSAEQERMRNPVDFGAFSPLLFFNEGTNSYDDVETRDDLSNAFSSLASQYTFLHYLTQEEANQFLKCKEQDRKLQINSLFKTQGFDEPISRLIDIRAEVSEMAHVRQREINSLKQEIERLKSANVQGDADDSDSVYIKLFNHDFDWDKENPQISYESYNGLLKDGGILDDLQYYCRNKSAYNWFEVDEKLKDVLTPDNLCKLSFWFKWRNSKDQLAQYNDYVRSLRAKWEGLNLSTLNFFSLDIPAQLPETLIKSEDIIEISDQINSLRESSRSVGELQRAYADMVGARDIAEKTLTDVESVVHVTSCPLCGNEFDTEGALLQRVQLFGKQLATSLSQITNGVAASVDQLKLRIGEVIIRPIDGYYQSFGFSPQIRDSFLSLDRDKLESQYSFLIRSLSFPEEIVGEENDIQREITEWIGIWRRENAKEIPAEFDPMRLRRVYSSYGRYFSSEKDYIEVIEKKRKYLTSFWNTTSSQLVLEKTTRLSSLEAQFSKLTHRARLIKQTIDKIKEQKNAYLSKMVGQIETLFYIYTGRIMQDNYYGRGCFLKYNQSNSNVLFTSGSPDNEVDAIYKMSSGQLISISVSFLLTVNKLYANQPFIAIDDPLQTIDDLNLWGLMETLRHDFRESTVLLSTHERDFGLLLTNKFSKVGLETEFLDMSLHH